MIYFLTDQALEDNTESDDNDADAPQDSDEAQDRGATQDRDEAQYAPGVATERRRDPDLPVVSKKRKRQYTKVTAKKTKQGGETRSYIGKDIGVVSKVPERGRGKVRRAGRET